VAVITPSYLHIWYLISFKGTHLVERMSLPTLIILSEAVMALAEKCQKIVNSGYFTWNASTIGNVLCAILILYFAYTLSFDWGKFPKKAYQ
jgi:low temperature requirement protein LtrA